MQFKAGQLVAILGCTQAVESKWLAAINKTCEKYSINTVLRLSAFIAQVGHESGRLKAVEENLNYSAEGLTKTFSKYFTSAQAASYARQPEKIANRVYASRMGNGAESSGEGYKYRGRGLIQCTGKSNYTECSRSIGVDCVKSPELLATSDYAALSAGWFWNKLSLNDYADRKDFLSITKKINGGTNGLDDRTALYNRAIVVLSGNDPDDGKTDAAKAASDITPASTADIGVKGTPGAKNTAIIEPSAKSESEYPYNSVHESRSGHVIQVDDTPGKEKLITTHRTGSYWAIGPLGTYTHKSVLDSYKITKVDSYEYTGGNWTNQVKGQSFFSGDGDMIFQSASNIFLQASRIQVNTSMMAVDGELNADQVSTPLLKATFSDTLASEAMVAWRLGKGKGGAPILSNSLGFSGTPGTEQLRANTLSSQTPSGKPIVTNGVSPAMIAAAAVATTVASTASSDKANETLSNAGSTSPKVENAIKDAAAKLDGEEADSIAETPVFVKHVSFDKPTLLSQSTLADAPDPALYQNNVHTIVDANGKGDLYISDGTQWRLLAGGGGGGGTGEYDDVIDAINDQLYDEIQIRAAQILAESQIRANEIQAEAAARIAALKAEADQRRTELEAEAFARLKVAQDLATESGNRVASNAAEAVARAALADRISAETNARTTAILSEARDRINGIQELGTRVETTITSTVTALDVLSKRVDVVTAVNGDYVAAIQNEQTARVIGDASLASDISNLTTATGNSLATINNDLTTVTTKTSALALSVANMATSVANSSAAINIEQEARVTADDSLAHRIDTISSNVANNSALISTESTARATGDMAISQRIDTIVANMDTDGGASAAVVEERNARVAADQAFASDLNYVISTTDIAVAAVKVLQNTQTVADTSLSNQITTLTSSTGASVAGISQTLTTLTDRTNAMASSITTLTTKVDTNTSVIQTETTSRTTADLALGQRIDTVVTTVNGNVSAIQTETTSRTTADTALGSRIDTIDTKVGNNVAAITSETTARTTADTALGQRIDTIVTRVGNAESAITSETTSRTTADTALGTRVDTMSTRVGNAETLINTETTNRTTADTALATRIDTLSSTVGSNSAAITSEVTARANAIGAMATRIDTLNASVAGNVSAVTTEIKTRTDADTALSSRIDVLTATVGTNAAAVTSEVKARADGDVALASRIDTLSSNVGTNTASIVTESKTRTDADNALSNRIDVMNASVGGNAAAIITERDARVSAVSAVSSATDILRTTVNGNTSTISTQVASINGLQAKYGVKVDNNGYISGFGLLSEPNNGSIISTFNILSDRFAIVKPGLNNGNPVVPFSVDSTTNPPTITINGLLKVNAGNYAPSSVNTGAIVNGAVTANVLGAFSGANMPVAYEANASVTTVIVNSFNKGDGRILGLLGGTITQDTVYPNNVNPGEIMHIATSYLIMSNTATGQDFYVAEASTSAYQAAQYFGGSQIGLSGSKLSTNVPAGNYVISIQTMIAMRYPFYNTTRAYYNGCSTSMNGTIIEIKV